MARFAPLYDVPIEDATADVRGEFFNTAKYGVDEQPAYFQSVTVSLAIVSPAAPASVRGLVAHAERACHAAETLRHGVDVRLAASLNGESLSA